MEKDFRSQKLIAKSGFIGQILLKKGLINNNQLEDALGVQKKQGGLVGEILVKNGVITEELLYAALAGQSELCYFPVEKYKPNKEVIKIIPKDIASKYVSIAVEKIGSVLTVAMTNPFNLEAISAIETATRYKMVPVISSKSQIEKLINQYY